jgi:thiamine phosphate synthase YjbQ (UPF0047 family)
MAVYQKIFRISTRGHADVLDITSEVERIVRESKIRYGVVNVSGKGSTLGITTIEYEPGAVADLKRALEKIAPPITITRTTRAGAMTTVTRTCAAP